MHISELICRFKDYAEIFCRISTTIATQKFRALGLPHTEVHIQNQMRVQDNSSHIQSHLLCSFDACTYIDTYIKYITIKWSKYEHKSDYLLKCS